MFSQLYRREHVRDSLGGVPVAVWIAHANQTCAEWFAERLIDSIDNFGPNRIYIDNVCRSFATALSYTNINHRQPTGRRFHNSAGRISHHCRNVKQQTKMISMAKVYHQT